MIKLKNLLKEYTDDRFKGSELISKVRSSQPDIFNKKLFADILPKGEASEPKAIKALAAHDRSPIKKRMGQYAPMFVHVQYHEFELKEWNWTELNWTEGNRTEPNRSDVKCQSQTSEITWS